MEQPPPTLESQPDAPKPPAMSLLARLVNVFAAPGDVFGEVRTSPPSTANWLAPALVFILASWVGAWLIFSQDTIKQQVNELADKTVAKLADTGKIPKELVEPTQQRIVIGTKASVVVVPVFAAFILPFWGGLIVWLVGAKVFKGGFSYMKAVEVAGLTNMIGVLEAIVRPLLVVGLGNLYASPSLMLAVKDFDPQNTLHGILAAVNVMTFWSLAVRSIGLARLSGVSFAKAAAWMFGTWAALTGLMIGLGAALRAVFGG
jgi:hypothetical protein